MIGMLLAGAFLALMAETFLNNVLLTIKTEFHFPQSAAQMAEHLFSTSGGGAYKIRIRHGVFKSVVEADLHGHDGNFPD